MDGRLADGRKGKIWFCKRHDGHALGLVVTAPIPGGIANRLLVFGNAVAVENEKADLSGVWVKMKLDGTAHEIECEICGSKRNWWNEQLAVNLLGSLYENEKVRDE